MGLPINAVVQVTHNYRHFSQKLMNVTHWQVTVSGALTDFDDIDSIVAYFKDTVTLGRPAYRINLLTPSTCQLHSVRAQQIHPDRKAFRQSSALVNGARGASLAPDLDVVITKRTNSTGRDAQSGFFLPGLDPNDGASGVLTDAFQVEVNTNMQWLKDPITIADTGVQLRPVIFHRGTGFVSTITNVFVQPEIRVMNRRQVGRGE